MSVQRFSKAADALAEAIRNDNPLFDNLGITIDISQLKTWDKYCDIRDKFHCHSIRRFFRRWLMPSRHRELGRQFIEAQVELQQEFMNTVMINDDNF